MKKTIMDIRPIAMHMYFAQDGDFLQKIIPQSLIQGAYLVTKKNGYQQTGKC